MAENFVEIEIETDAATLADRAVDRLSQQWPDWEPNDGDLEVVQIEAIAPMAANAAQVAAQMPGEAVQAIGENLIGLAVGEGGPALGEVTITLIAPAAGDYTIEAGYEIDIDGVIFATDDDAVVPTTLDTVAGVPVTATIDGTIGNDLTGANVAPITSLAEVEEVTLDAPTAGGSDAESNTDYRNRLAVEFELQARTLVTPRDHELMAIHVEGIERAVAIGNMAREVDVYIADEDGLAVSAPIKATLEALFDSFRQVNTITDVLDATYTTIHVSYTVKARSTADPVDLKTRIDEALTTALSPAKWGVPTTDADETLAHGWVNETVVRRNDIEAVIKNVEGVQYVYAVVLTGSAGTVEGVSQKDNIDFTGTVTGGTYTLTLDGQTTASINHNANATTVRERLEALSNVEIGDVKVTGGPGPTDMVVEHTGKYAYRPRTLTRTSSVTGGGSMAITVNTAAVAGNGDLTMPGTVSLPLVGTLTGTIL